MDSVHKNHQTRFRASDSLGLNVIVDLLDGMVSALTRESFCLGQGGTPSSSCPSSWPSSLLVLSFSCRGGEGGC